MASGTDTGPRPQLKKTPRHPIWNDHVRPWLGRRARRADERLTDQLGGPARRTVITLLGMVLGLNAADTTRPSCTSGCVNARRVAASHTRAVLSALAGTTALTRCRRPRWRGG